MGSPRPVCCVLAIALAVVPAVGCGGDDEPATTSTITVPTSVSSATTVPTTATTPEQSAPESNDGGGTGSGQPRPGSGAGAANAVIAAAAVLTRDGTPQQACGSFVTEAFISTAYGGEENCIAARRQQALARSILIGPDDDELSSRIVVVPKGGPYDGVEVQVDLVEDDGAFRVDALEADIPAGP